MRREIVINPRTVFRGHLTIIAGLLLLHLGVWTAYALGHQRLFGLRRLFDVFEEQNFPAYFSALALLACALAALANRTLEPSRRAALGWLMVAAGFALLSLDEACSLHELFSRNAPPLGLAGPFLYVWVIPYSLLTLVAVAVVLPFVRTLPPPTRRTLAIGGVIYIAAALGMEMLEGVITTYLGGRALYDHAPMRMFLAVEEGGEMLGVAVMLRGLLENMSARGSLAVNVEAPALRPSAGRG